MTNIADPPNNLFDWLGFGELQIDPWTEKE